MVEVIRLEQGFCLIEPREVIPGICGRLLERDSREGCLPYILSSTCRTGWMISPHMDSHLDAKTAKPVLPCTSPCYECIRRTNRGALLVCGSAFISMTGRSIPSELELRPITELEEAMNAWLQASMCSRISWKSFFTLLDLLKGSLSASEALTKWRLGMRSCNHNALRNQLTIMIGLPW